MVHIAIRQTVLLFFGKCGYFTSISNVLLLYLVHFDCTIIIIIGLHLITIASITGLFTRCNFVLVTISKRFVWKSGYFKIVSAFKIFNWFFLNTIENLYTNLTIRVSNFIKSKIPIQKYVQNIRYYRKYLHRENTNSYPRTYLYKGIYFL